MPIPSLKSYKKYFSFVRLQSITTLKGKKQENKKSKGTSSYRQPLYQNNLLNPFKPSGVIVQHDSGLS